MIEVLLKGTQKKVCISLNYFIVISILISFRLKYLGPLPNYLSNLIRNNIQNFDNILTENPAYEYGISAGNIYLFFVNLINNYLKLKNYLC